MNSRAHRIDMLGPARQGGITTIAITLLLLGIVTIFLLFSANVTFFDQKTATAENRSVAAEQMAEYAANLGGQFLNAHRSVVANISATDGGWLASTGTSRRWVRCPAGALASEGGTVAMTHPCAAERIQARREQMFYYDNDPATTAIDPIPNASLAGLQQGALTGADSSTRFTGTTTVNALLCRIGFTTATPPVPECQASPINGANVAVTIIATNVQAGESSSATIKETWATAITRTPTAVVPLIASGLVQGLGNAQIVAAPNAGGYGIPGSIWSPNNVDIGNTSTGCGGGGIGSVSTCHIGEYLQSTPRDQLKTTCITSNTACGCPAITASGVDFLSGHSGSLKVERADVLDADSDCGGADIQFFPAQHGGIQPKDDDSDPSDDSLFEYIFDVSNVVNENATTVNTNCGASGTQNCAAAVLIDDFNATVLANCSSLNTASAGIFYVTGDCDLGNIGSPNNSVVLVVDGEVKVNGNVAFYGMLFARSNTPEASSERVKGSGNVKIVGSLVVEGSVNVTGSLDLIYDNSNVSGNPGGPIPPGVRFGKVSGSWLDSQIGI